MKTTGDQNYCGESTGIFQWPVCKATSGVLHFSDTSKWSTGKKSCNPLLKQELVVLSEKITLLNPYKINSTCQVRSSNTHASFKSSLKSHLFKISSWTGVCMCVRACLCLDVCFNCVRVLLCIVRGYICSILEKWHIKEYTIMIIIIIITIISVRFLLWSTVIWRHI